MSKFKNHIHNNPDINFVPMEFDGKKIIYMKPGRSASTAIWKHTLKPYVKNRKGWSGGQGCSNKDKRSQNWLNNITDEEIKDEYFIFTFARNPFSRIVSCWGEGRRHVRGMQASDDFEFYVKNEVKPNNTIFKGFKEAHYYPISNHCQYDDGEIFTNYIGKIENIEEDWETLCNKISIPYSKLPLIYSGYSVTKPYKDFYTPELVQIISNYYKEDLELLNYEF